MRGALVAALLLALATPVVAADRVVVSLGTATPGGGFPVYDAVTATIDALEPTLEVKPRNTKGSTLTVPARSYPGQEAAIPSVGSWSFILARPSLPDDVTYRLARALHRGEADLAGRLPQARETTAANTVMAAPRRELLHPGVARYLTEAGLLK